MLRPLAPAAFVAPYCTDANDGTYATEANGAIDTTDAIDVTDAIDATEATDATDATGPCCVPTSVAVGLLPRCNRQPIRISVPAHTTTNPHTNCQFN